jgi:hypothetical protein
MYTRRLDEAQPVTVFDSGDELILADGYHRVEAARQLGRTTITSIRRANDVGAVETIVGLILGLACIGYGVFQLVAPRREPRNG